MKKARVIAIIWAIATVILYALIGDTEYFLGFALAFSAWELYLIDRAIKEEKK